MTPSPEEADFSLRLRQNKLVARELTPELFKKMLTDALEFHNCYFAYWETAGIKFMTVYRTDRQPVPFEFLAFLQLMFDDGQIHEINGPFFRAFFQGEGVYTVDSVSDMIGNAMADAADKDSNAEAFDFEKTKVGRRIARSMRNGQH